MTLVIEPVGAQERARGLAAASTALRRGELVVLPTDWMYGLAADAFSARGTEALRAAKGRPDLVVPVMVPSAATVAGIAVVGPTARVLMRDFWPGGLTLLLPAQPTLAWTLSDDRGRVAVRMPLHPLALDLLDRTGPLGVVAAAAGQPQDGPSVLAAVGPAAAVLLDAGPLQPGPSSAVVDLCGPEPRLVRPGPLDVVALREACPDLVIPAHGTAGIAP